MAANPQIPPNDPLEHETGTVTTPKKTFPWTLFGIIVFFLCLVGIVYFFIH